MHTFLRHTRSRHIYVPLVLALLATFRAVLPQPVAAQGSSAIVSFTDGDGLNLRDAPSLDGAVLLTMPEGAAVEVLASDVIDDTGRVWAQIDYAGTQGYSAADYLAATAPPAEQPPTVPPAIPVDQPAPEAPPVTAEAVVGGTDGDGLNVREGAGVDSAILTGLPEGASVTIVGGPVSDANGDPWYQVDADGIVGWAFGAFLVGATAPAAPPSVAPSAGRSGGALVAEALNYLGTPYVWAGVRRRVLIAPASPSSSSTRCWPTTSRAPSTSSCSAASSSRAKTCNRAISSSWRTPTSRASRTSASTSVRPVRQRRQRDRRGRHPRPDRQLLERALPDRAARGWVAREQPHPRRPEGTPLLAGRTRSEWRAWW